MQRQVDFLGSTIDSLTMTQTVERCVRWCGTTASPRVLLTVNAAILMMMRKDDALRAACGRADLTVADGVPVVWATHLIGDPLVDRVAGVDLMANLLQAGHDEKLRFFFLGAKQQVLDTLREILETRYPNLEIAGMRNGYFSEAETAEVVAEIQASRADILFIGMPTPFKEVWAERHRHALGAKVIIGVGGSFDVLAGYVKRAPLWMQKSGLEWSWRLLCEPRKMWKRYLVTNTQFLALLTLEVLRRRLFGVKAPVT